MLLQEAVALLLLDSLSKEKAKQKEPCSFCNNHLVDSDLDSDNDYSAIIIGNMPRYSRLMFVSGGYTVVPRIEFDEYNDTYGKWDTNGCYYPKFCPECGRQITERKGN